MTSIKKWQEALAVGLVLLAVFIYSLATLTTRPQLSFDEGFLIEEAHNFAGLGVFDIVTSPNAFSGLSHIANSSGFSATLPLALVFKVFGFSIEAARLYALFWMLVCLMLVYVVARRYFGVLSAFATFLLIATFPPFHNNARMVMGEIPGFSFLLATLLLLPKRYFWAGVTLGLCLISRPSLYISAALVFFIQVLYLKKRDAFLPLVQMSLGASVSFIVSFLLYLPGPLTSSWWQATARFFEKPTFGIQSSFSQNLLHNIVSFSSETTLIYFSVLIFGVVLAYLSQGKRQWEKGFSFFSFLYSLLVFLYFLRSPGWFKYLLPLQLLTFFYLPSAIVICAKFFQNRIVGLKRITLFDHSYLAGFALGLLVALHVVQLLFFASISKSSDVQDTVSFLNQQFGSTTPIAFIHTPQVAMFFPPERKWSFVVVNESLFIGKNPLAFSKGDQVPVLVLPEDIENFSAQFQGGYAQTLHDSYTQTKTIGRFRVFTLSPQ